MFGMFWNLKRKLQSLSDTCVGETCRYFDCVSSCLTSLSNSSHRLMHKLLSFTQTDSSGVISECCGPMLSSGCHNPSVGPAVREKSLHRAFRQIKKSMSSCLHQSTHCLSDGSTRYTTALLYPCLALSLYPTSISFYLDALPPLSLCLHSAYSPAHLYFCCHFPVRLWFSAGSIGAAVTGVLAVELD